MDKDSIIISDSSSNIISYNKLKYKSVPMKIVTNEKEFIDDENFDLNEYINYFKKYKNKSSTSCPNVDNWLNAFKGFKNIIVLTISKNLSGSFNSAIIAKNEYEKQIQDAHIYVIDSKATGPSMELILEKINEFLNIDLSFKQIVEKINNYIDEKLHILFALKSLDNLSNNGRVNKIISKIMKTLDIRILGKGSIDGKIEIINKHRTDDNSIKTIIEQMKKMNFTNGKVRIAHCFNEYLANKLKIFLINTFGPIDILIRPCTALCSYYAENGGIIVSFES